ncbi:MAG: SpoIIE family protein phosphatase [Lentisphaerae bacterium]|jgi:phosphoserine phosphatase RsbU/P|nr:SpoIIE family protein phosphatase [Lentisphaerota bacterium]MBT4818669.1 SpoIIE family protein phosphatase [Lentisphaerota bacterium]MBT5611280.1 SpoIIE family protein phosphatase [Lentisphaerota bacterium]MBT7058403.1 SpoIIE family protein phosphatase [Lentisphaerota bacterium]MBT7846838.1 SpoIIE family protein phosphatase [Lentisphaerota bacterium]
MNVLIADDDPVTRLLLHAYVKDWGHTPTMATDGLEAWELFQEESFPIVVTDWQMPRMDGMGLVSRIRGESPSPGYVYILVLTSRSDKQDIVEGIETGADDFVCKPFDRNELRARMRAGERILALEQELAEKNRHLEDANARILAANQRMTDDLEAAARIQRAFLPHCLPTCAEASFSWHFSPCDELAGDMLSVLRLDSRHVALYVADVCGHGVAAALLSVSLARALSRLSGPDAILVEGGAQAPTLDIVPPAGVAAHLNTWIAGAESELEYFTFLYGILNLETGRFVYVSAGHPGPIHVPFASGSATFPAASPPAIGLFPESGFLEHAITLGRGDRLYMVTDGAIEAINSSGQEFGQERIRGALEKHSRLPLEESVGEFVTEVARWRGGGRQADDVSVLALRFGPVS